MSEIPDCTVHVVSLTHWDREWYSAFQQFRYRLVEMTDLLLEIMETNPGYRYFVFDGQTIVLADYLAIRPENCERLKRLIEAGRICIGPWYVLCDEFLVSAESLIRNLLTGKRTAEPFGRTMNIGYLPDSFGHIPQMPQILRGFGIDNFMFTRGMPDSLPETGTEFFWEAPDGSSVIAVNQHLGYCNGGDLGYDHIWHLSRKGDPDPALALARFKEQVEILRKYANTPAILFHNGCDHLLPQREMPELMRYIEENMPGYRLVHSTFEQFLSEVRKANKQFKTIRGELRGTKWDFLWPGVLTSRAYLKQRNWENQMMLEHQAEPVSVITSLFCPGTYPVKFLQAAWELLLQNHPHDSICGCSTDQVHNEVEHRFDESAQIALQISHDLSHTLVFAMGNGSSRYPVMVWNGGGSERTAAVDRLILLPPECRFENIIMLDGAGRPVPFVLNGRYRVDEAEPRFLNTLQNYREQKEHFLPYANEFGAPASQKTYAEVLDITFLAEHVPPVGYAVYYLEEAEADVQPANQTDISAGNQTLQNGLIGITVHENGTFDLLDKRNGRLYRGLNLLEDAEDTGDEYDYYALKKTERYFSENLKGKISITDRSPVYVKAEVSGMLKLPTRMKKDRSRRSRTLTGNPVRIEILLKPGSAAVEVTLTVENKVKDHRLRAWFHTNVRTDTSSAGSQFCSVERPYGMPSADGRKQVPVPTHPMYGYALIGNDSAGIAVFARGLHEYEHIKRSGTSDVLALSLFRSVGWIYRTDNGGYPIDLPPFYTPGAQCLRKMTFEYAVMPVSSEHDRADADRRAWEFTILPYVFTPSYLQKGKKNDIPVEFSLFRAEPGTLIVTALKKAEKGNSYIIRFYNSLNEPVEGNITFAGRVKTVYRAALSEERLEELPVNNGTVCLSCGPYEIITLELAAI